MNDYDIGYGMFILIILVSLAWLASVILGS